jgi:hypothetical protein
MAKNILLNLVLLCLITFSLSTNCDALSLNDDCEFYKSCLEAKYNCGSSGYPVGYGYKYCSKFLTFFEEFPPKGKEWVRKTLVCLKQTLHPLYVAQSNCEVIYAAAFDSHPECYFQSGFCDLFLDRGNITKTLRALLKVYEIYDFMSVTSLKQVYDTAKLCGRDYLSQINQIFKEIFFHSFLEIEN